MPGQRAESILPDIDELLLSPLSEDGALDESINFGELVNIDFLIAEAMDRMRRENKHEQLVATIEHADWATAVRQVDSAVRSGNTDQVAYGEYLSVLLGVKALSERTSYTTAVELYDKAERLAQFVREKLQSLLEIQSKRPLQEQETHEANRLLKLIRGLQTIWKNDLYAVAMGKVRDHEMANIYWVLDDEKRNAQHHHSHEADIQKLGLTSRDNLSQRTLRKNYGRISRALTYSFIFSEGERKVLGLSSRQALHEVRGAYARVSKRLFPENLTATDDWVLSKQDAYSPKEWYLADHLYTFVQKLPELSIVLHGRRVNMIALRDELMRLDDTWTSTNVSREKIEMDLRELMITFEGEDHKEKQRSVPFSTLSLLWSKVHDLIDDLYGWDYSDHEIDIHSDEAISWRKKHLQRMVRRIVELDTIDPPTTADIVGYLFDVHTFRDLVQSLISQSPESAMDWRLLIFDLLPDSEIKKIIRAHLWSIHHWGHDDQVDLAHAGTMRHARRRNGFDEILEKELDQANTITSGSTEFSLISALQAVIRRVRKQL